MKQKIIILLCSLLFISVAGMAQNKKTTSFKVYGNCEMCKSTIEGALKKKDGVLSKKWDKETKMLSVTYNESKISPQQIGQKIADAGYDNEYAAATDAKYNSLHPCCQYERPKK